GEATSTSFEADGENRRSERDSSVPVKSQVKVVDPILSSHMVDDWRAAGGSEFVVKLVTQFINDAMACVEDIQCALDSQCANDMREAAHGLKGMAANMGLESLTKFSHQLETLGREQNLLDSPPLCESIQQEFGRVQTALQQLLDQEQLLSR
ncbi:MAG: Hpt domain-containing protein, partial [Nitrospirota bacterium]|nr:Hpt domain-containing protein [Nitrospirota bacterium]